MLTPDPVELIATIQLEQSHADARVFAEFEVVQAATRALSAMI
jgi:hypothetical protein